MIHIQKFNFWPGRELILKLPFQSEILSCQIKNSEVSVHYKVNISHETVVDLGEDKRTLIIYGAGWEIDIDEEFKKLSFICSIQTHDATWHVFEIVDI